MHDDITTHDARVAALNAAVSFSAALTPAGPLGMAEAERMVANTLGTAERFERWLTRELPHVDLGPWPADVPPPLALGERGD